MENKAKQNSKKLMMRYHEPFDEETASLFAHRSCKHCHGRGYEIYDLGKHTTPYVKYCSCVDKKRKKINRQKS